MREILFRAKCIDNGEWVYGVPIKKALVGSHDGYYPKIIPECDGRHQTVYSTAIKEETLGQYTGLTDKNGTKIFEGDILRLWGEGYDWNGIVVFGRAPSDEDDWEDYGYGWQLDKITKDEPVYTKILLWVEAEADGIDCEIIGNIYDNPELLKGDAENE